MTHHNKNGHSRIENYLLKEGYKKVIKRQKEDKDNKVDQITFFSVIIV